MNVNHVEEETTLKGFMACPVFRAEDRVLKRWYRPAGVWERHGAERIVACSVLLCCEKSYTTKAPLGFT